MVFTIGAFAIILDGDNRVLLCHRCDVDMWNLPGGRVESGETPWEAVVREVREETGFEVTVQQLHGVYVKPERDDIVFSFACTIAGGTVTLNDEADQIEWFAHDEMPTNTPAKLRERIRDALTRPSDLVLRAQFGPPSAELYRRNS